MVPELEHQSVVDELRRAVGAARLLERAAHRVVPAAELAEAEDEVRRLAGELERMRMRLAGLLAREDVIHAAGEIERLEQEVRRLQASCAEGSARERGLREKLAESQAEAEGLRKALTAAVPRKEHQVTVAEAEELRAQVEGLLRKMSKMVWRSEAEAARDEVARLIAELKVARVLVATRDEQIAALQGERKVFLRALDDKSKELRESAPRMELAEAMRAVSEAQGEADLLRRALVLTEKWIVGLCFDLAHRSATFEECYDSNDMVEDCKSMHVDLASDRNVSGESGFSNKEVEGLHRAVQNLKLGIRSTVPKAIHNEMEIKLRASEEGNQRLSREYASAITLVRSYVRAYEQDIEAIGAEMDGIKASTKSMVPSVQYNILYSHSISVSNDLCRLKKDMEGYVAKSHLDQMQFRSSAEIARLNLKLEGMVPKEAFEQCQDKVKYLESELLRAKAQLECTISKTLYCTAQDRILECKAEIERLQKVQEAMVSKIMYDSLKHDLVRANEQISSLQQVMGCMVPLQALQNSEQEVASLSAELNASNLLLKTKDNQILMLRADFNSLKTKFDMKCTELLDACPRSLFLRLQSELFKLKEVEQGLLQEQAHLETKICRYSSKQMHMVPKEDLLMSQQEAVEVREELAELKNLLSSGGLSDRALLQRFMSALKYQHLDGVMQLCSLLEKLSINSSVMIFEICNFFHFLEESQQFVISDVMALLRDLHGPSARSIHELRRILHILNQPAQMTVDELCGIRTFLRGMTTVCLEGLQSLLREGLSAEGIQSMQAELNACRSKLQESCESLKRMQVQNENLVQEVIALKYPHPPFCTAPYSNIFYDSLALCLASCDSRAVIYYTTDGRMPGPDCFEGVGTGSSPPELILSKSCILKAVCSVEGIGLGNIMTKKFVKKDEKKRMPSSNGSDKRSEAEMASVEKIIEGSGHTMERNLKLDKLKRIHHIPSAAAAGVGLLLEKHQDSTGSHLMVKSLIKDGAAENDGRVRLGDFLVAVDGMDIRSSTVEGVRSLISGVDGSSVELTLEREGLDGPQIRVLLTRSAAGFINGDLL